MMLARVLTEKELELVLGVLEAESDGTAIETRRSYSIAMTKELRSRLRALNRVIERLHEFQAGYLKADVKPSSHSRQHFAQL
jgi:hypothetical protein